MSKLSQARKGIKKTVDEDPIVVIVSRRAMVDDGFGGTVEDPSGEASTHALRCRLSHERRQPEPDASVPAGFSTNLGRFLTAEHTEDVEQGDEFEALGKIWTVGAVDPLYKFGGLLGYQAPVTAGVEV